HLLGAGAVETSLAMALRGPAVSLDAGRHPFYDAAQKHAVSQAAARRRGLRSHRDHADTAAGGVLRGRRASPLVTDRADRAAAFRAGETRVGGLPRLLCY